MPSNGMDAHTQYKATTLKPSSSSKPADTCQGRNFLSSSPTKVCFGRGDSPMRVRGLHISLKQCQYYNLVHAWSDNVGHCSSYKPRNVTSMLLVYKPFPITPWSILHALISHRHFCSPRRSLHLTLRSAGARITWRWIMDCVNLVQFAAWTVMKCQLLIIDVESNALAGWVLSGRLLCGGSPVGHVRIHSR